MIDRSDNLRRGPARRTPRPEIIVVCEGKVTEPQYFSDLRAVFRNTLVKITAIGGCGVPVSVVERAIFERKLRIQLARKTGDSFDSQFEVWAVFDRDEHPKRQVPDALDLAKSNGVSVAYSNPCFELWGLMHFSCYARPGHHHEVQAALKRQLPGYCHEHNPVVKVSDLRDRYETAVKNARQSLVDRQSEGTPLGDPSTNVFELTEKIKEFGQK